MADVISKDIFDRLPERYQRRAREIASRVAELKRLMARCDVTAIADAAGRLQGQLRWQPETDHEAFGAEFKTACADLPEWAVSEATNDFLAGRVENHTGQYMPTCAEFARHARTIVAPFLSEMSILRREAEHLFVRAEDERRRAVIALQRADPAVKNRVKQMMTAARAGAPVVLGSVKTAITDETQEKLDALKKKPEFRSKIHETRLGKGGTR